VKHRRPGAILYGYVARELVRPTLLSLVGLTAVVLTKDLLGYSDLVINRGFGADAVALIAFYQVVPLLTMIFPLAVLMGALFAMGRMGSDLEILVLETLGIPATRLVGPFGAFALAMTAIALALSVLVSPWASRSLDFALEEMSKKNPGAQIRAGIIHEFGDWQIQAREVSARGDSMKNVLLWVPSIGETIFARAGLLETGEDGSIRVTLEEGRILFSPEEKKQQISFATMTTMLPESNNPATRSSEDIRKGASIQELLELGREEAETHSPYPQSLIELHRRISLPVTTLVFGLLAVPLFLSRKEYSRSAGGILGLGVLIAYFGMVQLGNGLIQNGKLSAAAGVWFPNLLVAILAGWLFASISRRGVFGREFDRQRGGGKQERASGKTRRSARRFPLPRYVAGRFLQFALLAFAALVSAYLLIDILDRLQWFARYQASALTILNFYAARLPVLASRVVPMSLLVATALTASHLAVQGELIGMRACGIPAPKALLPVLVICSLIVPAFFVLNNELVPRASARQDEVKREQIWSASARGHEGAPIWYRVGGRINQVDHLDSESGSAEGITFFEMGEDGLPISRTDAASARHFGRGNWRLQEPTRIEWKNDAFRMVEAPRFARLGKTLPAAVDTMHLRVSELRAEIADIESNGLDATALRVDLQVKLATPLACIVLPAIILFFAVGGPPFATSATTLLLSIVLGVGWVLLSGTGASLGYGGALNPLLAGWGPVLILSALAAYFGLHLRARGQPLSGLSRRSRG
jgi:lipopolysaccharide export system permease protein